MLLSSPTVHDHPLPASPTHWHRLIYIIVGLALRREGVETSTLLLAGVAVSLSASAIILFLQYLADSTQTFRMVRWMMGGLSVVGFQEVLWLLPWILVLVVSATFAETVTDVPGFALCGFADVT